MNKQLAKEFARYLFPSVASLVSLSLYILADTFFVANGVGSMGLAGLNIVLPAYSLINAIALMCGAGAGVIIAIGRGSGDSQRAQKAFENALALAVVAGVLFMVVGVVFTRPLVRFLGASGQSEAYAATYLRVIMAYACIFTVNTTLCGIVRSDGNPKLAMSSMMANSMLNIILDYVFVMVLQWGMFGAAFATGLSAFCGICVLSLHWRKGATGLYFHKKMLRFDGVGSIIKNGASNFIVEIGNGLIILLFNITLVALGGDTAVAAYGIVANIALVVGYLFTGVGQGLQPLVGEYYGKGDMKSGRAVLAMALLFAVPFGVLFFLLGQFAPGFLAGLFNQAGDVLLQQTTVRAIRIYFTAFLFMGVNSVASAYLQSVLRGRSASAISLLRTCLLVVAGLALLPRFFGMDGVWMVIPLAEGIAVLVAVGALLSSGKTKPEAILQSVPVSDK